MLSHFDKQKTCPAMSWLCLCLGQLAPSLVSPDEEDSTQSIKMCLQDNTGRLLKEMATAQINLDSLFAELDVSLAQSRQVFSQVAVSNSAAHVLAQRDSDSNAATLVTSSSALEGQTVTAGGQMAAEEATPELQVPAYVHVGDPLVANEPDSAAQLCNHGIQW